MSDPTHLAPRRQKNWDWRAAANFICGGSAGALLLWTAFAATGGGDLRAFVLGSLALIGTGLTCVWFELGRPWRAINVLRHGSSSWMTREAIVAALLFCSGTISLTGGGHALALAATGGLGLAFLYSQARILAANKGIPAWRHRRCVSLVMTTGLAEGAGLLTPLALIAPSTVTFVAVLLAALACLRMVAWRRYLGALRAEGAPTGTIAALSAIDRKFVWAGNAAPVGLALVAAAASQPAIALLAGCVVVISGAWAKYTLVCRAAFVQGFALPKVPVRGAGVSAPGVQPGWENAKPRVCGKA
ncbi:MAG TPA: DmsC/YnfH family molybdoenzyme membrane anchor subunit [Burkholderiaceae bacterium]|nr:DmsC/YnfH family molybdoenzyme membrane anchor subunit [Burkholderiaceae bacterium]